MAGNDDATARAVYGYDAYRDIPKSVFALIAWQQAIAATPGDPDAALARIAAVVNDMATHEVISHAQAKSALRHLPAAQLKGN